MKIAINACTWNGYANFKKQECTLEDFDLFAGNLGPFRERAAKKGLTMAFHNHRGCVVETAKQAQELVTRLPELQLCADIAHSAAVGDDALKYIKTFRDRIAYLGQSAQKTQEVMP